MAETGRVLYADTSALLKKPMVREAETEAVDHELSSSAGIATSSITVIDLRRAV